MWCLLLLLQLLSPRSCVPTSTFPPASFLCAIILNPHSLERRTTNPGVFHLRSIPARSCNLLRLLRFGSQPPTHLDFPPASHLLQWREIPAGAPLTQATLSVSDPIRVAMNCSLTSHAGSQALQVSAICPLCPAVNNKDCRMLETPTDENVVRWGNEGDSFVVLEVRDPYFPTSVSRHVC